MRVLNVKHMLEGCWESMEDTSDPYASLLNKHNTLKKIRTEILSPRGAKSLLGLKKGETQEWAHPTK